jgi:hypothetical protein
MLPMTRKTEAVSQDQTPLQSLFQFDVLDRVLLSVHLLGKPTTDQLFRLHSDIISTPQKTRLIMAGLRRKPNQMLAMIKPIDIAKPFRKMPYVYLDTTLSRRRLEKLMGVTFRRPSEMPSRDWRFLRHDVTLVDELISLELTARRHNVPFGYESHFDTEGAFVFPYLTIADGSLSHRLRPRPDKTLIIGKYHVVIEHDCGEETVALGNIIRDATIARKHLVYDQLERSGALDDLEWGKRIYAYIIDGKRSTLKSSRKRVKRCLETVPAHVNPHKIFFVDRQTFMQAGDDVRGVQWVRGDGTLQLLPCW